MHRHLPYTLLLALVCVAATPLTAQWTATAASGHDAESGTQRTRAAHATTAQLDASASTSSTDIACFDWICSSSGSGCDFDASCSVATPSIWKFYWLWGDGTTTGFDPSPLQSHVYPRSVLKPTVTLQVWTLADVTTVSCQITNREGVGHPLPYFSGRCSSE